MKLAKIKARDRAATKRTKRKQELIEIVKRSSLECGKALMELRDDEHWKDTHTNFKEFCREVFDISASYLYDLINGVSIRDALPENLRKNIITESQTRVLAKVPEEYRPEVVRQASKYGFPAVADLRETAERIVVKNGYQKSACADSGISVKPESKPVSQPHIKPAVVIRDMVDNPVTNEAMPYWNRYNGISGYVDKMKAVLEWVERCMNSKDSSFSRVPDSIVERLKQAYFDLLLTVPYSICPKCHGEPSLKPNGCDDCGHTGMISKVDYDKLNPAKA